MLIIHLVHSLENFRPISEEKNVINLWNYCSVTNLCHLMVHKSCLNRVSKSGVKWVENERAVAIFIIHLLNSRYFFMVFLSTNKMVISLSPFVRFWWEFQNFKFSSSLLRFAQGLSKSIIWPLMGSIYIERVRMSTIGPKSGS